MKIINIGRIVISQDENGGLNAQFNDAEIDMQGDMEMTSGQAAMALLLHVIGEISKDEDYDAPIDKSLNTFTYIDGR